MKRKYILSLSGIAILVTLFGTGCYAKNQIGKMNSTAERKGKYAEHTYYSTAKDEFVSPQDLAYYPEQTQEETRDFGGSLALLPMLRNLNYLNKHLQKRIFLKYPLLMLPIG